jgi:hypothetical protein
MDKLILILLLVALIVYVLVFKIDKEHFNTKTVEIQIPEVYPISVEHNDTDNDTILRINELTKLTIDKVNKGTHTILFNSAMRQTTPLKMNDEESTDYGEYIVNILNDVAIYKQYQFNKILNISKDEMENQVRLNFHLSIIYTNSKSKSKIPLLFNVIMLFEQLYDDGDIVMGQNIKKDMSSYLSTFRLIELPNMGYIPGTIQ